MAMPDYMPLLGTVVPPENLATPFARELIAHVRARHDGAFSLVEARQFENAEGVILDVHPELPQRRVYDFENVERLLIYFCGGVTELPLVLALRVGFPRVPHMNLVKRGTFPWLCLFGEDPEEVRRRLTPHVLAERILWWFAQNAKGILHRDDQALEPFLSGSLRPIYFPASAFDAEAETLLTIYGAAVGTPDEVLIADDESALPAGLRPAKVALLPLSLPTQRQGVIYEEPENLRDLSDLCTEAGFNLLGPIFHVIRSSISAHDDRTATIVLLRIPKARGDGEIEAVEYRAFRLGDRAGDEFIDHSPAALAIGLGLAERHEGHIVPLLVPIGDVDLRKVAVSMLLPRPMTDRQEAARLNDTEPVTTKILAVGMGALGSQVFAHLARRSFGDWMLVDSDSLEPHNLARHEVFGRRFGILKAVEMTARANEIFKGDPMARHLTANVASPGDKAEALRQAIAEAELLIDMTASTAACRALALEYDAPAPRTSMFLSPSGYDLIFLSEAAGRAVRVDCLEVQYLRAIINDPSLSRLLESPSKIRTGPGCRDRSAQLPNELISLHAAIAARAIAATANSADPSIQIWRADPITLEVKRKVIAVAEPFEMTVAGWTLIGDQDLLLKIQGFRSAKLPHETCGVLIGQFDALRRRLYVFDALSAPPDSVEEADGCKRGIEHLESSIEEIRRLTGEDADYVGEWHSHPDGALCSPSQRDLIQMAWIQDKMHPAGLPALMFIACDRHRHNILFGLPGETFVESVPDWNRGRS